jgi:hypothetical protein
VIGIENGNGIQPVPPAAYYSAFSVRNTRSDRDARPPRPRRHRPARQIPCNRSTFGELLERLLAAYEGSRKTGFGWALEMPARLGQASPIVEHPDDG